MSNHVNVMPVLTVIVPIYNASLYLDECLQSLLEQGLSAQELEVILVVDGSTDGSEVLADKWSQRHQNFRVLSQPNQGLSAARNAGLDTARGTYLIFLDSDDIVPARTYRNMLTLLQRSGSDFVTSSIYRFSRRTPLAWPFERNIDLYQMDRTGLTFANNPEYIRDFTAWNKMYRREFFLGTGVRFPVGKIYEDVATSPLLYDQAKSFDVYSKPGYFWRVTPGSITQTLRPAKALDRLWAVKHILDHFGTYDLDPHARREIDFAVVDYNLRWVFSDYHLFESDVQKEILKRTNEIAERLTDSSIARVEAPISTWAAMSKAGELQALHSILRDPVTFNNSKVEEVSWHLSLRRKLKIRDRFRKTKRFAKQTMFETLRRLRSACVYLLFRPLVYALPLDSQRVIVTNYWGKRFSLSDGPAAIAAELAKTRPEFRIVVFAAKDSRKSISQSVKTLLPRSANVRVVTNGTLGYYYNIWRAKFLFNDVNFQVGFRGTKFVAKRRGQVEVQTTHGIPLKKMGLDSASAIPPNELDKFLARSNRYDFLVSSSPEVAKAFADAHGASPELLQTGLPQNDFLFEDRSELETKQLKSKFGLDETKKIIVYAPTFRNGRGDSFPFLVDFRLLAKELGDDYQVVVKMHPFNNIRLSQIDFLELTDQAEKPAESPFVKLFGEIRRDIGHHPVVLSRTEIESRRTEIVQVPADINELMLLADVLITDYSSVMFNYTHLNKPLILFTPDNEAYEGSRGCYFNIDEIAPGSVAKNNFELLEATKLARSARDWNKTHKDDIAAFRKKFLLWEQGEASQKILNTVIGPEI